METKAPTSEGTKQSQMEFGHYIRKRSMIMRATEMLQVTFAVGMCHSSGEDFSVSRPHMDKGLCAVLTVAGEKAFCY